MIYDLQAHTVYSWDLINPSAPCSPGRFDGDGNWQDPFAFASSMAAEITQGNPKHLGTEAINGVTTEVLEAAGPGSRAKVWIEQTYGLVIRLQVGMGSGPYETKYEVKNPSFSRPEASVFALPAACAQAAATAPPLTESMRIAADTGGSAAEYADATEPPLSAPSKDSCNVLLRVARAGTMEPVRNGFQVALDLTSGLESPKEELGEDVNGRLHFLRGALREVTGQLRDGVLSIPNPPPLFRVYIHVPGASGGEALIYRQCFRPETVLLVVLPAEKPGPGDPPKQAHWLWVKAEKAAGPSGGGNQKP
jgi:hypothetical protein